MTLTVIITIFYIFVQYFSSIYTISPIKRAMFAEEAATKSPLLIAFRNPAGDLLIRIKISINADSKRENAYLQ